MISPTSASLNPIQYRSDNPSWGHSTFSILHSTNIVYRLGVISGLKRVPHFLKKNEENSEIVVMGETFNDF